MATASFPVTFPSATSWVGTQTLEEVQHADDGHNKDRAEIIATQTKVGLGSSVASGTTVLVGTGGTTSGWHQVGPQHIAPGTTTMLKLFGTITSGTLGSVAITIPSSAYQHLLIEAQARSNASGTTLTSLGVQFNHDAGSSYFWQSAISAATSVSALGAVNATSIVLGAVSSGSTPANTHAVSSVRVLNYAGSLQKAATGMAAGVEGTIASNAKQFLTGGGWSGTAPISTITLMPGAGSFLPGCQITVYGVPA